MNIISTLLCRELRRLWLFLVVWMISLFLYFSYHQNFKIDNAGSGTWVIILFFILVWLAWVVLISVIVHEAPPSGSSEFWMTRPISGNRLFVAKITSIFLICVLTPALTLSAAKMAGLAPNEWIQSSGKYLSVCGLTRTWFIMSLGLAVMASVTRNLLQYIIGICFVGFVFGVLTLNISGKTILSMGKGSVAQYHTILEWTLIAIYTAGVLFIIHRQYTRRSRTATVVLCVLFGLALYGIWHLWPVVPQV